MIPLLRLLRPHQWIKNLFLFIPVFFAGELFTTSFALALATGFVVFCLVSSSVYIINDLRDVEADRAHPEKKKRPLASGEVSTTAAISLLLVVAVTGLILCWFVPFSFALIVLAYFVLNVAYSFGLKNVPILDMMIISFGFILRVYGGGVLGEVPVTEWLVIMIFLLSLFLAIAKRRDDVLINERSGTVSRSSTRSYNLAFINSALTMISGIMIVAYLIYTISPEVKERIPFDYLYGTSVFVVAGILRYLQITLVEDNSGSPIKILYTDLFIQLTLMLWVVSFFYIIYVSRP